MGRPRLCRSGESVQAPWVSSSSPSGGFGWVRARNRPFWCTSGGFCQVRARNGPFWCTSAVTGGRWQREGYLLPGATPTSSIQECKRLRFFRSTRYSSWIIRLSVYRHPHFEHGQVHGDQYKGNDYSYKQNQCRLQSVVNLLDLVVEFCGHVIAEGL